MAARLHLTWQARSTREGMLKIQRTANGEIVLTLSGRIVGVDIPELQKLLMTEPENRPLVLDLKDLTLVDQEGVSFLERCEVDGIQLKNCPAYIREWITRLRSGNFS
jgi:hypothetical protein